MNFGFLKTGLFLMQIGSIRSEINSFISTYAIPIIAMFLVIGAGIGLVMNFDKIIDKDGNGTRKEGLINLLWVVAYVMIGIVMLGAVVSLVSRLNLKV